MVTGLIRGTWFTRHTLYIGILLSKLYNRVLYLMDIVVFVMLITFLTVQMFISLQFYVSLFNL